MAKKNIVLIGGGVGSSTFTKALKDLPINLSTIVSAFDDGGATGAIRRDYGGIALGDFRQCIFASIDLHSDILKTINHRFGRGNLYGINVGNLLLKAFLEQHPSERVGVTKLHRMLGLKNSVVPVSYDFAKLCAALANGRTLGDESQIAAYYSFHEAPIKSLSLSKKAELNADAKKAMKTADYLAFVPGNFFTSLLPHLYVKGFRRAWNDSKARKIWFVNLLAHRGQDSFYTIRNYLRWFEKRLGKKPFDLLVINQDVSERIIRSVKDRFEKVKVVKSDIDYLNRSGIRVKFADLLSPGIRKQQENDLVPRAPLRHDIQKVKKFFINLFDEEEHRHS